MDIIISCLLTVTVTAWVIAIFYTLNRDKLVIRERLADLAGKPEQSYLPPELNQPFYERVLGGIWQYLTRIPDKIIPQDKREAWARKLLAAGNPHGMDVQSFMVFKYLVFFIMLATGLLLRNSLALAFFIIIGLLIPNFYLKTNERKRRDLILKSLPDILDLLNVSVEAGLGFDAALQKVIEKYSGPLAEEFEKTLQEINMGKPRREALRDMAERVNIDEVSMFLASIIQADQLGVSITNVLRLQSQQVRANRRMRAEEKAQQAPVKILIPLLLFIFPAIIIVLLGPAAIQLMDTFK